MAPEGDGGGVPGGGEGGNPSDSAGQAQGQDLASMIRTVVQEVVAPMKDSLHAEVRRHIDGRLSSATSAPPKNPPKTEPASSGITHEQVREIVARERAIDAALRDAGLTGVAFETVRGMVESASPDDVGGFVKDLVTTLGLGDKTGAKPQPSAPEPTNVSRTVTNPGSPGAPPAVTEDTPLWLMRPEDRQRLINEKGVSWYREHLRSQLKGVQVKVRNQ